MKGKEVVFRVKNPINFNVLLGYLLLGGINSFNLYNNVEDGGITGIDYFVIAAIALLCVVWLAAAVRALIGPRTLGLDYGSVTLGKKTLQSSEIKEIIIHHDFMGLVNVAILPKGKKIVPVHWSFRMIDDRVASLKALEAWATANHVDLGWGHFIRWL
ncbi:hypothetical protein [Paenibacillus medicaginis]|uniref:PH domain-containing protein n=1 Tax=Paenibacillus medicaginis TaxID=1470560 RepID=A0ABV5C1N6_9BACL